VHHARWRPGDRCHSGAPDWGSGPTGKGKLFKITYSDPTYPQPVFVWPTGPHEIRVEFDRAMPPELLHDLQTQATLTGADTCARAIASSRSGQVTRPCRLRIFLREFEVPLRSAQLTPDGRTLVLATDPVSRPFTMR